jgi:hypothetical protein
VTDSIPCAQAEMHTNMRLGTRQRRAPRKQKTEAREGTPGAEQLQTMQ